MLFTADNFKFKDVAGTTNLTLDNNGVAYLVGHLDMGDNDIVKLGDGDDLQIHHNGSHNYIDLNNGNLYFRDDADNNIFTIYREGGGVQLNEGDITIPATSKLRLDGSTSGNSYIFEESGDNVVHYVGGQNKMRFNSTGVIFNDGSADLDFRVESNGEGNMLFVDGGSNAVVVGNNAPIANVAGTGALQVLGTGGGDTTLTIGRFSNNSSPPTLAFTKSRNGTIGSNTIVQDGDNLGQIVFSASDGSDMVSNAATWKR